MVVKAARMPRSIGGEGKIALSKRRATPVDTFDGSEVGDDIDLEYDSYDEDSEVASSEQGVVVDSVKQYLK